MVEYYVTSATHAIIGAKEEKETIAKAPMVNANTATAHVIKANI